MQLSTSARRVVIAAGAVLVLGGSAVGIAAAQSATPTPQSGGYQKFIDALAQKLGVSSQTLQDDITQVRQAQGLPANGGFPGGGRGGPRGGFGAGLNFQTAATAIGITPQQLRTELQGKSMTQVAQAHGKNPADVANALKNEAHQRIDQAVANGRLTADQGNTAKTNADQRIDQMMTRVVPAGGPAGGPGGPGGPGAGPRGPFGFGAGIVQQGLNTAATAIGITPQQLRTELQQGQGQSLAQVAQAHGKTGADVATALKNEANKRIDDAVTSGRLTADQANTMKANIDQRIDTLVNQVVPQGGPRRGPGAGAPGGETDQSGA
jgi:polyhydroxyalkanoate synthesis regulator phasin